jgi:hypothetical protein
MSVVSCQPTRESPVAYPFQGEQQSQGHHFTGIHGGLAMLWQMTHHIIHSTEQFNDKILSSHRVLLIANGLATLSLWELDAFFQLAPKVNKRYWSWLAAASQIAESIAIPI